MPVFSLVLLSFVCVSRTFIVFCDGLFACSWSCSSYNDHPEFPNFKLSGKFTKSLVLFGNSLRKLVFVILGSVQKCLTHLFQTCCPYLDVQPS